MLRAAAEDLELPPGTAPFDLDLACRMGVLDGRHPRGRDRALARIHKAEFMQTDEDVKDVIKG